MHIHKNAYVDLAANSHVYFDLNVFENFKQHNTERKVCLMNGNKSSALGAGDVHLLLTFNGVNLILRLCNVQYIPAACDFFICANLFNLQFSTLIVLSTKTGIISHRKIGKTLARLKVMDRMYCVAVKLHPPEYESSHVIKR